LNLRKGEEKKEKGKMTTWKMMSDSRHEEELLGVVGDPFEEVLVAAPSVTNQSRDFGQQLYAADDAIDFNVLGTGGENHLRRQNFNFSVFFFEFFTQLLFPLSVPVVLAVQNAHAARNKGFLPGPWFAAEVVLAILFVLPVAVTVYFRTKHDWGLYAISVSFSLAVFRKLVIAGKYACFPKKEYEQLLLPGTDISKNLLLTTWHVAVSPETLDSLIEEAETSANVALEHQYFTLSDGHSRLSAKAYLRKVVHYSFKPAPPFVKHLVLFLSCGTIFLPLWLFIADEKNKKEVSAIVVLVVTLLHALAYSTLVFGFINSGILHYWRFMRMHLFHARALALAGNRCENRTSFSIPASVPINLVVWASVRNVIRNFGRTYTMRISFNFFALFVISGFFVLILLQQLLSSKRSYQLIAVLAYLFIVFTLGISIAILLAVRTNRNGPQMVKLLHDESYAFMWRRLHRNEPRVLSTGAYGLARYKGSSSSIEKISSEDEWREVFDVVKDMLQQGNDVEPLVVMFVPGSPELLSFILSVFVSGMTLVLGVLSSQVPGVG
jgi:hypothetical protein